MIEKKEVLSTLIALSTILQDIEKKAYGGDLMQDIFWLNHKVRNIIREPHLHFNIKD